MKISEAIKRYIDEYLVIKGTDENQLIHTRALARLWVEIVGDMELEEVSLEAIGAFKSGLATYGRYRCHNTVRNYLCELRMVLKYWKLRGEPCLDYELIPAPKREPVIPSYLSADEVQKIIDSTALVRTKFIISILYASGIRVSELVQLNRDTIRNGCFTVIGKGKKPRICFLDARAKHYMELYLESRTDRLDCLIATKDGTRASAETIQLIVRNATARAGIAKKVSPHTLRHSFATNYIGNGGNIRHLADLLGHASLNTTAHYTHLVNGDLMREYMLHHTC
jgi:site-specific recombinase XerD